MVDMCSAQTHRRLRPWTMWFTKDLPLRHDKDVDDLADELQLRNLTMDTRRCINTGHVNNVVQNLQLWNLDCFHNLRLWIQHDLHDREIDHLNNVMPAVFSTTCICRRTTTTGRSTTCPRSAPVGSPRELELRK